MCTLHIYCILITVRRLDAGYTTLRALINKASVVLYKNRMHSSASHLAIITATGNQWSQSSSCAVPSPLWYGEQKASLQVRVSKFCNSCMKPINWFATANRASFADTYGRSSLPSYVAIEPGYVYFVVHAVLLRGIWMSRSKWKRMEAHGLCVLPGMTG